MKRLKNRTALITGAARGIGKATAMLFHREGAHMIIIDVRDVEETAVYLPGTGPDQYDELNL